MNIKEQFSEKETGLDKDHCPLTDTKNRANDNIINMELDKSGNETTYYCNPNTLMKTINLRSVNTPQPKVNNLHKKASINRI
jgi:hypothetical protein